MAVNASTSDQDIISKSLLIETVAGLDHIQRKCKVVYFEQNRELFHRIHGHRWWDSNWKTNRSINYLKSEWTQKKTHEINFGIRALIKSFCWLGSSSIQRYRVPRWFWTAILSSFAWTADIFVEGFRSTIDWTPKYKFGACEYKKYVKFIARQNNGLNNFNCYQNPQNIKCTQQILSFSTYIIHTPSSRWPMASYSILASYIPH